MKSTGLVRRGGAGGRASFAGARGSDHFPAIPVQEDGMVRRIRGGGVAALAAALVFGSMTGSALADDAKKDRKEQKRIGESVAEKELYVGKLALFDAKQIALGNM